MSVRQVSLLNNDAVVQYELGSSSMSVRQVSLLNNDAVVQYEPTLTDPERLAELASAMGFKTRVKKNHYRDTVVFISGMTCVACVRHIEGSLSVKPGVLFARVSLESRLSYVKYDPDLITAERIRAAIYELGFGASLEAPAEGREGGEEEGAVRLTVEGMTCGSCVASVEGALKTLDGVTAVRVSLEQGTAELYVVHTARLLFIAITAFILNEWSR